MNDMERSRREEKKSEKQQFHFSYSGRGRGDRRFHKSNLLRLKSSPRLRDE